MSSIVRKIINYKALQINFSKMRKGKIIVSINRTFTNMVKNKEIYLLIRTPIS